MQGGWTGRVTASERLRQAGLFQRVVCPMTGRDLGIDHEVPLAERTTPDLMVASALAFEAAASGA
jgi:hypothetical protein